MYDHTNENEKQLNEVREIFNQANPKNPEKLITGLEKIRHIINVHSKFYKKNSKSKEIIDRLQIFIRRNFKYLQDKTQYNIYK